MISHLTGTIIHKNDRYAVLDVGGVGYKVFVPVGTLRELKLEKKTSIWTHLAIRENSHDLYGFSDKETLELFELLITVSGIGPKTALNVLNVINGETLRRAVSSGDLAYLTKVSGLGKKIAEKIVIELKEKLGSAETTDHDLKGEADALEALKSLGYSEREAREAVKKVSGENLNTSEKVKKALKILGENK